MPHNPTIYMHIKYTCYAKYYTFKVKERKKKRNREKKYVLILSNIRSEID